MSEPKKEKYYFTFMQKQSALKDKYVVIEGTFISTRKAMGRKYDDQWAFQYDEKGWLMPDGKTQAEHFGLTEIKL